MTNMSDVLSEFSTSYPEYEIVEKLGEGASRVAFRAKKKWVDSDVVVKFFKDTDHFKIKAMREKYGLEELFQKEINAIRYLNHPNIIRIQHHGKVADTFFIEEEFMDGGTLKQNLSVIQRRDEFESMVLDLAKNSPFERMEINGFPIIYERGRYPGALNHISNLIPKKEHIINSLLNAASHIVSKGFLPIDLKPDNIFLNSEGEVKLGDLEMIALGESSSTVGSRKYSAPEVLAGSRETQRSIVYTVGRIMAEIIGFDEDMFVTNGNDTSLNNAILRRITGFNMDSFNMDYSFHLADRLAYPLIRDLSNILASHPSFRPRNVGRLTEFSSDKIPNINSPYLHLSNAYWDERKVIFDENSILQEASPYQKRSVVRFVDYEDLKRLNSTQRNGVDVLVNSQLLGLSEAVGDVLFDVDQLSVFLMHMSYSRFKLISFYEEFEVGNDCPDLFVFNYSEKHSGLEVLTHRGNKSRLKQISDAYNALTNDKKPDSFKLGDFVNSVQEVYRGRAK